MANFNSTDREKYLINLILEHYKKDRKDDYFYNKIIKYFKKLFNKSDEYKPSKGYLENEKSIEIYEKIQAEKITAKDTQCLIIARNGKIKGSIEAKYLYISGKIEGDIKSKYLFLKGEVDGDIDTDYLEIFSKGKIEGNVSTNNLVMHKKTFLNGNCKITKE